MKGLGEGGTKFRTAVTDKPQFEISFQLINNMWAVIEYHDLLVDEVLIHPAYLSSMRKIRHFRTAKGQACHGLLWGAKINFHQDERNVFVLRSEKDNLLKDQEFKAPDNMYVHASSGFLCAHVELSKLGQEYWKDYVSFEYKGDQIIKNVMKKPEFL